MPLAWGPHADLKAKPAGEGEIEISLGDGNPHFWTGIVPAGFDPQKHRVFELEYFAPNGLDAATLRFRTADGKMAIAGTDSLPLSETWQPWAFDLSRTPAQPAAGHAEMRFHVALHGRAGTVLRIRRMRLREMNAEEQRRLAQREQITAQRSQDAQRIRSYLDAQWPAQLHTVHAGLHDITLSGVGTAGMTAVPIPPEVASHAATPILAEKVVLDAQGRFRLILPRLDPKTQRDRATWRWRLADEKGSAWLSAAKWPTAVGPALGGTLPRMQAKHAKGLGGIPHIAQPEHEIFQLGIAHATINLVVNAFIRDTPAPGHVPWPCEGRTYFIHERLLHSTDATLRHLSDRGIIVSGILLIGNHRHADGRPHHAMTHPEAELRGIFSMPNLTAESPAQLYAAGVRLLAERYDGSAGRPGGRIANWIIHNEIDQAGTWTNMGDQPLERYLESYMRSARLVHHTARLFDHHARVFISLTHHWTQRSSGTGTYIVRDMLELFAKMARAEGDYEWGVAYHPYPRDLRNPDTWADADVSSGFDTLYITPKNLEVLPAFLNQERFHFAGKPRGILLSEQGFNTPTLSASDQRRQAAGLVYVFQKLAKLPQIEAYHLHRYQDAPAGEGGLRLGIITETGAHKLGWDVYREIGTGSEKERQFTEQAKHLWDAK